MIRVLIVDDHPVVLSGFAAALAGQDDVELAGQAGTVRDAVEILRTTRVDVTLLDLRLPDGSGIEVLEAADALPDPPAFLVISTFESSPYIDAAIRLGAAGFLVKTAPLEVILEAVRRVAAGLTAFTVDQLRRARLNPWDPLSEREAAIIAGLIAGRSNDELSADLQVSRKTIEAYLTRLYERYDVATRVELAVKAARESWLDLPRPSRSRGPRLG